MLFCIFFVVLLVKFRLRKRENEKRKEEKSMKLTGTADFLASEIITSKSGKSFKVFRFVDSLGKTITAFANDLNLPDLERYGTYEIIFDYTENGSYKSLNYIGATLASELDI